MITAREKIDISSTKMNKMIFIYPKFLCCVVLLACMGCDNSPQRVPVTGIVLIDGKPVTRGFLRILPASGRAAFGEISSDGRFTMTSMKPTDGCVPGQHPVEIVSVMAISDSSQQRMIPAIYANPSASNLKVNIADQPTELKIELTWNGSGHKGPYLEKFDK